MNLFEAILQKVDEADEVEIRVPSYQYALVLEAGLKNQETLRHAQRVLDYFKDEVRE